MKKQTLFILLTILASVFAIAAQENTKVPEPMPPKVYKANPEDVKSIDSIIKAVYDVISGDAGVERNWDRMRSLFHKDARLIPSSKNPNTGKTGANVFTVEDYIKRSGPFLIQNGFHEQEIARKTDIFGNIAQVFSTYEGRNKLSDEKPFLRGINSFQLMNDGERWWVITIYWQQESKESPVPEKYLKSGS